ncbi:universal stress protein [Streptomyces sp. NBC_00365]|uniref:universal stress protein n=1 Tax=Streptomyces sp. NBC_00365 TaxID=2975726 RepID=UPI00225AB7A1|nr:universal stress protein [Streptomyces sp. NBC_00365]MCX5097364.1 universal stress protein [Streptomyces sp. NBC_00365]
MIRVVAVGLDGSPESLAAADWAARESLMSDLPLRLVHVGDQQPRAYVPFAGEPVPPAGADRSVALLRETVVRLHHRHPGLRVDTDQLPGQPVAALVGAARDAELLVLGSRDLGANAGFLLGSVASAVIARAEQPVVLVRAGAGAEDEHLSDASGTPTQATPYRDVVVGLDLSGADDTVLGFAFAAASRRAAGLRVVHGRSGPELQDEPGAASARLLPWKAKFPGVEVIEESVIGDAGSHLADASREASLVVVGCRVRRPALGAHIGPVTAAVLRRAATPVAVVPHD